ncbi:MAG: dihydropteroate synthase [Chlorobiales bacterium]|nr:dihydropteroate synthase [Chlorobiales bacterium]
MSSDTLKENFFQINCAGRTLDLSKGPVIMGILNTTPDSFYDGGAFQKKVCKVDLDRAFDHALAMIHAGASIIDIGGESSRPGAEIISEAEEIERTVPLITLLRQKTDVIISIDTYKANVAEKALQAGAHLVNDISGFTFDHHLPAICRKYQAAVILMHTLVKPESMDWSTGIDSGKEDIIANVSSFLSNSIARAKAHSINDIIIDPGFGFGKSVKESFRLLNNLGSLLALGRPILAGVSRKSFLGHAITKSGHKTPPPSERLPATIAAGTIALYNGASILRVHDVEAAMQSLRVVEELLKTE